MSRRGLILFLLTGVFWGLPYFFIAIALDSFSTPTIVFARTFIGALVLVPYAIMTGAAKKVWKAWPYVLLFAALEMVGPWWLITEAERYISSGLAGLLISVVPFFAVLIAYFFQGDKSVKHPKTVFGLVVGFLGVVLLVGIDSLTGFAEPLWVGATILAALGYAIAPAIAAQKMGNIESVGVISMSMGLVAIIYAPSALSNLPGEIAANPPLVSWVSLVVLGVVCSALAFVLFFALFKEIGSARATLITYMNTAVALVLGIAFLNEPLTVGIIVGFPLVLIGSWYSVRRHESKQGTDATVGSGAGLGTDAGISAPGEGGKPPIMAAGAGHRPASEVQTE